MAHSSASALVVDQGRTVLLRVRGKFYELRQEALRAALGLPDGPPGLGITIDRGRIHFEFTEDQREIEMTADQLRRRLVKKLPA